ADGLRGGHVILLNAASSPYYKDTKAQALAALGAYPGGLMVGGGINADNAGEYLSAGASHVIVTSYVFREGRIDYDRLGRLVRAVGKEYLVLDLSCRRKFPCTQQVQAPGTGGNEADAAGSMTDEAYYIVTDRWQNFTGEIISEELLDRLSEYCSEFLVHAVDVEGKNNGIEARLAEILGKWCRLPITYAGGVRDFNDLKHLRQLGQGRLNVTIGSALDIFGGDLKYRDVLEYCRST
ncbi:MAG: hypothetical protein LIO37_05395, partial [Clostridiales bacterium]|nr:hypothetical protein [Clostridiales bacterium]